MMCGDHWMSGCFMWLFWILIIVGAVFLINWVIRQSRFSKTEDSESPLEILKKRYAKGEIDKEKFEKMKKDLEI